MKNLSLKLISILLTSVLVSGCGFHLRGQGSNLDQTQVWLLSNNANASFERTLKQRLNTQGGELVENAIDADLQLAINGYEVEERIIGRDSQGRASELELIFSLSYQLANKNDELANNQELSSRREFAFNRNLPTGQEQEKQRLIKDMQQDIISRLLLQMAKSK